MRGGTYAVRVSAPGVGGLGYVLVLGGLVSCCEDQQLEGRVWGRGGLRRSSGKGVLGRLDQREDEGVRWESNTYVVVVVTVSRHDEGSLDWIGGI